MEGKDKWQPNTITNLGKRIINAKTTDERELRKKYPHSLTKSLHRLVINY